MQGVPNQCVTTSNVQRFLHAAHHSSLSQKPESTVNLHDGGFRRSHSTVVAAAVQGSPLSAARVTLSVVSTFLQNQASASEFQDSDFKQRCVHVCEVNSNSRSS